MPPQDRPKDGRLEIHPCVLQDIGPLRPLPCSHSTASLDHFQQGIRYRWPCAILGWLVQKSINHRVNPSYTTPNHFSTRVCPSVCWFVHCLFTKIHQWLVKSLPHHSQSFLEVASYLYKRVCPSVCRLVRYPFWAAAPKGRCGGKGGAEEEKILICVKA